MRFQNHALICPYLFSDKDVQPAYLKDWDAYKEYYFLEREFRSADYGKCLYRKILNYYYFHCVLIYRYDLFYAAALAVFDTLCHQKSDDNFIRSLAPDLRSDNELDTFYTDEAWVSFNRPTNFKYKLVQKITSNKGLRGKPDHHCVLNLNNPVLGRTLGSNRILHWDKNRQLGFVSYRDEVIMSACKKMIGAALSKNKDKLLDCLYIKDKKKFEQAQKDRSVGELPLTDTIVFYQGTRLGVSDNSKYVLNAIMNERDFDSYRLVWIAHKAEMCKEIESRCTIISLSNFKQVLDEIRRAKIVIYDDDLPAEFTSSKHQILVSLWHAAINYKRIALDSYEYSFNKYARELFKMSNPIPDFMVAGSQSFIDTGSVAFGYDENVFVKTGLPRNDVLFVSNNKLIKETKTKLGIDLNKKIVLYAPTWRKGNRADLHSLNPKSVVRSLSRRFGGDWVFLYRGHTFTTTFWNGVENAIDVSNYPDSQEIILISDIIISDYSSLIYDAAIANKPVFLYIPDYKRYLKAERGFYIDPSSLPFPISYDNKELLKCFAKFDKNIYLKSVKTHLKETGSFDKGDASLLVVQCIKKVLKSK